MNSFSRKKWYLFSICGFVSLCRWKHLLGYFTKSMEPHIWCCCYIDFHSGTIFFYSFYSAERM